MERSPRLRAAVLVASVVASADASAATPAPTPAVVWALQTTNQFVVTPEVHPATGVVFGHAQPFVFAVTPNGSPLWNFTTNAGANSSPKLSPDGALLVVGSDNSRVYALRPGDGSLVWAFESAPAAPVYGSPAFGPNGDVVIGADNGAVYSLRVADGGLRWRFNTSNQARSTAAIGADGTAFIGSDDGHVYALTADGAVAWTFTTGDLVRSSPLLVDGGAALLVGSYDHHLYKLNTSAAGGMSDEQRLLWRFRANERVRAKPALCDTTTATGGGSTSRTIVFGDFSGAVLGLSEDGAALRFNVSTRGIIYTSPACAPGGAVVAGSYDGSIMSLDAATGAVRWNLSTAPGYIQGSPSLSPDGATVYIGSSNTMLYALANPPGSDEPGDDGWLTTGAIGGIAAGALVLAAALAGGCYAHARAAQRRQQTAQYATTTVASPLTIAAGSVPNWAA
jgi:eukaryotic-like serine/threonine-protein kinase